MIESTLSSYVPTWVSILFLIAIIIPIIMIANVFSKGGENVKSSRRIFWAIVGFFVVYFTYVNILGNKGLYELISLPPRILRFTMIPLLIFLVVLLFNMSFFRRVLSKVPLSSLISVHIFRLIGVFFVLHGIHDGLPAVMAYTAGFGDIITALLSLVVARQVSKNGISSKGVAYAWNTFGLLDILWTAGTAFYLTKVSIDTGVLGVEALAVFPFWFIPAFAPATIIFLHVCIYWKLWKWGKD